MPSFRINTIPFNAYPIMPFLQFSQMPFFPCLPYIILPCPASHALPTLPIPPALPYHLLPFWPPTFPSPLLHQAS